MYRESSRQAVTTPTPTRLGCSVRNATFFERLQHPRCSLASELASDQLRITCMRVEKKRDVRLTADVNPTGFLGCDG